MKIIDKVRKALDPRGPIGNVVSPSDVFKERAGLPVSAPHTDRYRDFNPIAPEMLAAPRFVTIYEIDPVAVPLSRMRLASPYIEEHFEPVYASPEGLSYAEVMRRGNVLVGWTITQRARSPHCDCLQATLEHDHDGVLIHRQCGRARKRVEDADFAEHILRLQFAPSDDFYNMYYETIPGNDPVIMEDGKVLKGAPKYNRKGQMIHDGTIRGGTQIRQGRRQYRTLTKNMVLWDKGVVKEREKAYAAEQKAWLTGVRPRMFKANKQMLPRKIGEL